MPSAEELAELEADQEEANQQAQQMQDAALQGGGMGGGGKPPPSGEGDPSEMSLATFGQDH
jgi:hypothetical protein